MYVPAGKFIVTVSAVVNAPRWAFTFGVSDPESARRYYAEVNRVPLSIVSVEV